MKEFMKKHPALEDTCDTVLSLLSGSFALLAVGFAWIKELTQRKKSKKSLTTEQEREANDGN